MTRIIVIIILILSACSFAPVKTISVESTKTSKAQEIGGYSDDDVESLVIRFPFLHEGEYGTPSPEDSLDQLGINLSSLDLVDRRVGDCYDEFKYDFSPSYWLMIDHNACFGLRIRVISKDTSG